MDTTQDDPRKGQYLDRSKPCPDCEPIPGVVWPMNGIDEVERCDNCRLYSCDDDAAAALAAHLQRPLRTEYEDGRPAFVVDEPHRVFTPTIVWAQGDEPPYTSPDAAGSTINEAGPWCAAVAGGRLMAVKVSIDDDCCREILENWDDTLFLNDIPDRDALRLSYEQAARDRHVFVVQVALGGAGDQGYRSAASIVATHHGQALDAFLRDPENWLR